MPERESDPQSPNYFQATQREATFLHDWFNVQQPVPSLRMPLNGGGVVIRERASVYHDGHQDPGFVPDLAWLGDQGLILGGAVDFVASLPNDPKAPEMLKLAEDITDGVLHYFVATVTVNGTTAEYSCHGVIPRIRRAPVLPEKRRALATHGITTQAWVCTCVICCTPTIPTLN